MSTLLRLLGYLKPQKGALLIAFLFLGIATATDMASPLLVKTFIDDYLSPRNFEISSITFLVIEYSILLIAASAFNYLQLYFFQKIALKVIQKIRIDVFSHVQDLSVDVYDKTPVGALVSCITNDTEAIKSFFVEVLTDFCKNTAFIIGIFTFMMMLNFRLGSICLILIPIIIVLTVSYSKVSAKVIHTLRQKLGEMNANINETLQGMNIIQVFRQEKRKISDFKKVNEAYYKSSIKNVLLNSLMCWSAIDLLCTVILALIFFVVGVSDTYNTIEIGVLYAFINYVLRFFEPIKGIMRRLTQFQEALVSAERVFNILDDDRIVLKKSGNENPKIEKGRVEFKNVSFSYDGKNKILKNISFIARPGQTIAIVGQTGSGKSTIINLLMRFYHPQKGKITLDNISLTKYENKELSKKIGLVLQDPVLFSGDIKYNIHLNKSEINNNDTVKAAKFVRAHEFIEKLPRGYSEKVTERGSTFSSGQRQLLSFARTVFRKPKVLILDEATAHVDTETEAAIQEAMEKITKERTTIIIAHRLSTIQNADEILVMHKGEIVERGTHHQLLALEGLYHKMYLLQQAN